MEKLNGQNYHLGKFKMQMLLKDKEVWEVVDDTMVKPPRAAAQGPAPEEAIRNCFLSRFILGLFLIFALSQERADSSMELVLPQKQASPLCHPRPFKPPCPPIAFACSTSIDIVVTMELLNDHVIAVIICVVWTHNLLKNTHLTFSFSLLQLPQETLEHK